MARDVGISSDVQIFLRVMTNFAGSGASLQVQLQTAPDNGSGSPGSWTILAESQFYLVSSLTQGAELLNSLIPAGVQKFLKLTYVVTGANMTAGALWAGLLCDRTALGPGDAYRCGVPSTTYQYM